MRIAVTGASGQLGTTLLRALVADRGIDAVVALDVRPPRIPVGRKTKFVRLDVRDPDLADALGGCEAVVHLAFRVFGPSGDADFFDINVRGSRNVFESAARAGVAHIVHASSVAAYGVVAGHPVPVVEETPRIRQDRFPYAAAKYDVEDQLDRFELAHRRVVVTRLRPGVLVGERMDHPLGALLHRRVMFDHGPYPVPVVWDQDVADAIVLALHARAAGAFNLCAQGAPTPREAADAMGVVALPLPGPLRRAGAAMLAGLERVGVHTGLDAAWLGEAANPMVVSSKRAHDLLHWQPRAATGAEVYRRFVARARRSTDPSLRLLVGLIDRAAGAAPPEPSLRGVNAIVHLHVTGARGADVALRVTEGSLRASMGVPEGPTSTVAVGHQVLGALLTGAMDFSTAQLTGRVRSEGEFVGPMILAGIVGAIRQTCHRADLQGRFARGLAAWVAARSQKEQPS